MLAYVYHLFVQLIYAKEAGASLSEKITTKTRYKDSKKNNEEVQLNLHVFRYRKMKKGIGGVCRSGYFL